MVAAVVVAGAAVVAAAVVLAVVPKDEVFKIIHSESTVSAMF